MAFLAPVVSAIGGVLAGGGIGAFALKLGGSLILSAASSALMKRGKTADAGLQGRAVSVREAAAAQRLIYGRVRVGGTIIFMMTRTAPGSSQPNNELHMIIVLAGHRVRSIGDVYLNGELAFNADGAPTPRFAGNIGLEKHLGAGTAAPFPYLRSIAPDQWTEAHRLVGCAAIAISFNYSQSIYPSGIPSVAVDVEGCDEVYDLRTDTAGWSDNPALCLAHYMAHPRLGLNAGIGAADGVALAELAAAANVCDEVVARVGGGTEKRYTLNGVVDTGQPPKGIIEDMLTAMAGDVVPVAGQYRIFAGAWRPPAVTLTDDDVVDGGFRMTTRISRAENFNAVRGKFVSPENDWAVDDFPAYASDVYLAEDNGERVWTDITLPFTTSASMAQRLAKIHLERQRRQFTVTFPAKLSAWRVAPMDTVALTRPRWGFAGKLFEVRAMSLDIGATIEPSLTLREASPLIYDWTVSEAQIYAAAPRTDLPNAWDIAPPGSPVISEAVYETRPGDGVKALATVQWAASASPYAVRYQVESRLDGGPWVNRGQTDALSMDVLDIGPGRWDFRVKALSALGVSSDWSQATRQLFGLTAPPAPLANVTAQIANGLVLLSWAQSADLDVRTGGWIEIRHSTQGSPTVGSSYLLALAPGVATQFLVSQLPGTYFVRAVDSTDTPGPAVAVSVAGETALNFAPVLVLQADPGFTGTKTRTELSGGFLRISPLGIVSDWTLVSGITRVGAAGGISPEGQYDFATGMNLGSLRRVRLRSLIRMAAENPTDQISQRFGAVSSWRSISGGAGGEVDVVVEVRTSQTDPSGSPVWSAWSRLDSTEVRAWGVQARAFLRTRDPSFTPAVDQLRVVAEEVA